ncbi:Sporulation-specific protease [Candidatus Arthromitus sp. SFB-mouse-NL]|uniref:sporulation peptidase YabG n=1 Tax=Candidatus Arthromitus sp. SFB-mouse-NL TaxID=1508644 RepID=UPI000499DE83|nr:sporulation peptidase YabG [Candidatus Arthromitus sp. SFB-mouse-NL]AID45268.1 Sporulation-specific protease [Candidatus Arthromitus sp. SFB-mouse-NL]
MKIGDIVVRKSYDKDIKFKIADIKDINGEVIFILKGKSIRIIADALKDDLEIVDNKYDDNLSQLVKGKLKQAFSNNKNLDCRFSDKNYRNDIKNDENRSFKANKKKGLTFGKSGKILHVDGDLEYLNKCIEVYEELFVNVYGECVDESKQPDVILDLVSFYKPDIVVLTGHDSMSKNIVDYMDLNCYKNSKYFMESVCKLRSYEKNLDDLVIFAGACQSCYEALIGAGANFATSPGRVLVHCLDPVLVCSKIFNTSIDKTIKISDVISETITGFNGIGGIQTRGKYREGFPKSFYM